MPTIANLSMTIWTKEEAAQAVADANNSDDPDCEYQVVMRPDCRFVIAVIERGEAPALLGYL